MKTCKNCTFNNPDTANYCGKCGHALGNPLTLVDESEYRANINERRELNSQVKNLEREVDLLKHRLDTKNDEVTSLALQLEIKKSEVASLRRQLSAQKSTIERLTSENDSLREELEDSWWKKLKEKLVDAADWLFSSSAGEIIVLIVLAAFWILSAFSDKIPGCTSNNSAKGIEIVSDSNGKWGIFDHDADSMSVACQYDSIRKNQNYYLLYSGGKVTIANDKGRISVATPVDQIYTLGYGGVRIYSNDKQGLMDDHGNLLVPCDYYSVFWYNNPTYPSERNSGRDSNIIPVKVSKDGYWLLLNRNGKLITNASYYDAKLLSAPDLVAVKSSPNTPWILMNSKGETRPGTFSNVDVFYNNHAIAKTWNDKAWVAIDLDGKEIWRKSGGEFDFIDHYSDDVCAAIKYNNNQIIYLDKGGHPIFDKKYYRIYNEKDRLYTNCAFSNGRAHVSDGQRPGYIDKKGNFTPEEK